MRILLGGSVYRGSAAYFETRSQFDLANQDLGAFGLNLDLACRRDDLVAVVHDNTIQDHT